MKASCNFTGRKRLANSDFDIKLYEGRESPSRCEVRIGGHHEDGVPDDAAVWVEAYRGPRMMRFNMGRWIDQKGFTSFTLDEFDPAEPLLFRIKVVEEGDRRHPIKAWRDRIRPITYSTTGQKKKSVLPVYPCDLGHIAWRIDWTDPTRPVLQVNSRINEARDISSIVKKDPDFAMLVFPQVIREVLTRLLIENADEDDDAEENEWMRFASNLAGRTFAGSESDEEENCRLIDEWVNSVAQSFARQAELLKRYMDFKSVV